MLKARRGEGTVKFHSPPQCSVSAPPSGDEINTPPPTFFRTQAIPTAHHLLYKHPSDKNVTGAKAVDHRYNSLAQFVPYRVDLLVIIEKCQFFISLRASL